MFSTRKMSNELTEELLEILACPLCKGDLTYDRENNELICFTSNLAYPIKDGIPIMLADEARKLEK